MTRRKACILVLVVTVIPGPWPARSGEKPQAPTSPPLVLTLEAAQEEAHRHAPEALAWLADLSGFEARAADARRSFREDPTFAMVSRPPRFLQNPNDHLWDVSLSVPVNPWRTRVPRQEAAEQRLEEARRSIEEQFHMLDEQVARAFADLALAQRASWRAERLAALTEEWAKGTQADRGKPSREGLRADRVQFEVWRSRVQVIDAHTREARARYHLARLLGRAPDAPIQVDDSFSAPHLPPEPDFEALVASHPRVVAAQAALSAARAERMLAERMVRPAPVLGVSYGLGPWGFLEDYLGTATVSTSAGPPQIAFTLLLSLPLFDRQRTSRLEAQLREGQAAVRLQAARADVRHDLEVAWSNLAGAFATLQALQDLPETLRQDVALVTQLDARGILAPGERIDDLRAIEAAASMFDEAVRQWRYATAAWVRVTHASFRVEDDAQRGDP